MKSIQLERPMYYKNEFSLRFELGPPEVELWTDRDREIINEEYFRIASQRAFSIFKSAFLPTDEIKICYQIFSDGRQKIKKGNYLFKLMKNLTSKKVKFTDHRDIYSDVLDRKSYCWKRVTLSNMCSSELDIEKIIETLVNTDFGIRGHNLKGELYILNCTKGLVFNIYDDRGMDIVSEKKEALTSIYHEHNKWLLGYDKEHMDSMFS